MKHRMIFLILAIIFSFTFATTTFSADILHRLTHNDQYALILGQVTKADESTSEISVARIISGHRIPARIWIRNPQSSPPKPGEKILVSLERGNDHYQIRWGLFRVSSLDPKQLRIIKSTWPKGDQAALEHYIHSSGVERDFFFVHDSAFLRYPDGTFTRIYPELPVQQRNKHFRLMICPERWNYRFTDSSAPGIGLYPIYYLNSEKLRYCWRTNYGRFSRWEPPDYRVIPLGMTATVSGWGKIYWTPSITQEPIPKEGIKISLTVKDSRRQTSYEQTVIGIEANAKIFRVK